MDYFDVYISMFIYQSDLIYVHTFLYAIEEFPGLGLGGTSNSNLDFEGLTAGRNVLRTYGRRAPKLTSTTVGLLGVAIRFWTVSSWLIHVLLSVTSFATARR